MSDRRVYEVSHIVDEDYSNPNKRIFRVRWLGYTPKYDSWEPLENLQDEALEVVRKWDINKKQNSQKRKAIEEKSNALQRRGRSGRQINDNSRRKNFKRDIASATIVNTTPLSLGRGANAQNDIVQKQNLASFMSSVQTHVQAGTPLVKKNVLNERKIFESEQDLQREVGTQLVPENSLALLRQTQNPQHSPKLYSAFLSTLDNVVGPPIWIVNDIDAEPSPPLVFKWTEEYHLGSSVPTRDDSFAYGCNCPGSECSLRYPGRCACLEDSEDKKFAYDADGLVQHPPGIAIFECNDKCGCGRTCPNRVTQRGRRMPLELFKTQRKGWGVRTCRPIPKGMFICRYVGEVVTEAEAERRGKEYDRKGITYLFDLDFFRVISDNASDIGSLEPTAGNVFCVDAMHYGNVSRFFNHSCNPNVAIYTVIRNGDNRIYDLAIFTIKAIKPYEELCFDYKTKNGVKIRQQCYCGERNCKGWLFGS